MDRRDFLRRLALGAGALGLAGSGEALAAAGAGSPTSGDGQLPQRKLGRTGLLVSCLAFGGGSQFLQNPKGQWEALLERAVQAGVNYFDTCSSYSNGESERRYGAVLPKYRERVIIATKTDERSYDGVMRSVERSLKNLRIDCIDVMQFHLLTEQDDLPYLISPRGGYRALHKLREEKVVRFIGASSHQSALKIKQAIEALDLDLVLIAMNATKYGDFIKLALPAALQKGIGVNCIKVMKDVVGNGPGKVSATELLHYVLNYPITAAVVGHANLAVFEENLRIVKALKPLGSQAMLDIEHRTQASATPDVLSWAREGYRDDGTLA